MPEICPLRFVRGPRETTECICCTTLVKSGQGYPIVENNNVLGYICVDCYEESSAAVVETIYYNNGNNDPHTTN